MSMNDTPVRFGMHLIYANGEFEMECKTAAGAKRCIAKLRRLRLNPTVRRHAWTADGRHCNVDCGTKNLTVRPPTPPACVLDVAVVPAVALRPAYQETRREQWADGSFTTLPFAIRVF